MGGEELMLYADVFHSRTVSQVFFVIWDQYWDVPLELRIQWLTESGCKANL